MLQTANDDNCDLMRARTAVVSARTVLASALERSWEKEHYGSWEGRCSWKLDRDSFGGTFVLPK